MLNINNIFTFIKSIIYNYYKYLINNVILFIIIFIIYIIIKIINIIFNNIKQN